MGAAVRLKRRASLAQSSSTEFWIATISLSLTQRIRRVLVGPVHCRKRRRWTEHAGVHKFDPVFFSLLENMEWHQLHNLCRCWQSTHLCGQSTDAWRRRERYIARLARKLTSCNGWTKAFSTCDVPLETSCQARPYDVKSAPIVSRHLMSGVDQFRPPFVEFF